MEGEVVGIVPYFYQLFTSFLWLLVYLVLLEVCNWGAQGLLNSKWGPCTAWDLTSDSAWFTSLAHSRCLLSAKLRFVSVFLVIFSSVSLRGVLLLDWGLSTINNPGKFERIYCCLVVYILITGVLLKWLLAWALLCSRVILTSWILEALAGRATEFWGQGVCC